MKKKILLVEDDADLLEMMRLCMKREGFSIATASNGIEALKKARSLLPDVIVLDLVLPELDGFAVCETLRKHRATAGIKVIMLTGLSSEFTRYAGFESGADDYVMKPVSPTELVSKIDYWLSKRGEPSSEPQEGTAETEQPQSCVG
jgi:DNA-binding response OmpR family regulator